VSGTERKIAHNRDPLVGTVINGKFHVEKAIARGGMGRIYFGRQAPLDRPVALKIVKADSVNEEESQFLKRFLLEASILAKLQHPNVVTLFDYGRIEGAPVEMYFIAMEYLDGETLTERLRAQGSLACYEALILFRQLARGLREAHSRGVIHRDLKPSNIVIVPEADGEIVKLVDFGIGKVDQGEGEDLTRDGVLVGTPKYMAPEQFDGGSSPASDVYALGIIIYQCLAGVTPFSGNTLAEIMIAKLQHPIVPLREANPISDVTENVEHLVLRMLARRPEERPSLDEVFQQLAICEEEIFGSSGPRLGATAGSRPGLGFPNSSRPISVGALRVPYTIVAAPQPMTGSSSSNNAPILSGGLTPRPMATSSYPGMSAPKSSFPVSLIIGLIFAIGTLSVVGAWLALKNRSSSRTTTTTVAAPASAPPPAVVETSFTLHLDSNPSGAAVTEDGKTLGATPIDLKIDRASIASGPRTFQIKKDGFLAMSFAQGPTAEPTVETIVPLAPDPTRTVKSGAPHNAGGAGVVGVGTKPPNTAKGPSPANTGEDIRLKR
jgi:serine/threonine protein kinase